ACGIAAGPIEASDDPELHGVATDHEHDRKSRSRRLGCTDSGSAGSRNDYGHSLVRQVGRERREPIILTVRVAVLDRYVSAFGISHFAQPPAECSEKMCELSG